MEQRHQYRKLYELLRKHILSGVYAEGSLLPSENELCATYGMTRPTVRHALDTLVKEGMIAGLQDSYERYHSRPNPNYSYDNGGSRDLEDLRVI